MKIRTKRYKKLMSVLLQWVFANSSELLTQQIVLRFALKDGYVELNENKDFVLSDKGLRLIKED